MSPRLKRIVESAAAEAALMALRAIPEAVLGTAIRRLRQRRPDVFERLGTAASATVILAPTDLPVLFRLTPDAERPVRVARRDDDRPSAARISGPLVLLLGVLDGGLDADAAFFSREIRVSGDTETVVSLHNTLEAAALSPSDLLGAPAWLRGVADAAARGALSWGQARRTS